MALIVPKDNGSMLRAELLKEAVENGFQIQLQLFQTHQPLNDRIYLSYPISKMYEQDFNIQINFNGIELRNDTMIMDDTMNILAMKDINYAPFITNMISAKMITLIYRGERMGNWTVEQTQQYEMSIIRYFQHEHKPKHTHVLLTTFVYINYEVSRAGLSVLPYLILGFGIMLICTTISMTISAMYMQQMSTYKIYLAFFACICPLMANVTAIGLLLIIGIRYDAILSVTPILTLAIGVDDAYLMIHTWQNVTRECNLHPVKNDCVAYRLALVLEETGPAILISALTNVLADAVGAFTGSPNITILCLGNMASILINYIYQLTFYSAIMCIIGHFEIKAIAEQQNIHSIKIDNEKKDTAINCCRENSYNFHERSKDICESILESYITLVTNQIFVIIVLCSWALLIIISISGIIRIKVELTPEKLFPLDSPLLKVKLNELLQQYQIPEYTMIRFYVNKPGNLSNTYDLQRLNQMVSELEHMDGSWGSTSTNYFIRDFIDYEKQFNEEDENHNSTNDSVVLKEEDLPDFLNWPEYQKWHAFCGHLIRFFFTTSYYGENLKDWPQRGIMLNKCRNIVDKYSEFNVTVFMDDALFLDLIDNMATDAWQSALGILICMAFISFIFLYDTFTVIVVSIAIISIMTGIVGLMNLMDFNLEPIMVAAILISMGFSVDIPAHVAYHYINKGTITNQHLIIRDKLRICFSSVALPALQAAISTSLCLLGLLFKDLYIAQVFVKTMLLCISLCVSHGLLIIPCMLVLVDQILQFCSKLRKHKVVYPTTTSS
ncbi:Patched domain-containing protein 3 [Dirofilaria immitis]|nr:Patched domain-containing protein 3 [Dirofilaria immitis]